jgi:hypothetical protein
MLPVIDETIVRAADKIVRTDAYPAFRRDGTAEVKIDRHPDNFVGEDKRSRSALVAADAIGKRAVQQMLACRGIIIKEPADHVGVKDGFEGVLSRRIVGGIEGPDGLNVHESAARPY